MLHISYLLCSLLTTAHAETPILGPKKLTGPSSLPPTLNLDGSSPVLEEQKRQRETEDEDRDKKESDKSTTSSGNAPNQIRIGANTGAGASDPNYPSLIGANQVNFNFPQGIELMQLITTMAQITGRNFILTDEIKGNVTVISHKPITVKEAYQAFLSILEVNGYTTVYIPQSNSTKIVATSGASNAPLGVRYDGDILQSDQFVTQIIQLNNVSVTDVSPIVKDLSGKAAKIITYAPTNTLIITDAGANIQRVYNIISKMDVAAPKSEMRIIPLKHATASDIQQIIEELYGDDGSSSSNTSKSTSSRTRRTSKSRSNKKSTAAASSAEATNVGTEEKYIEKIISDERTNSLIVMANENALEKIIQLIKDLDVDVDPASRAQIHVVYLEHAKAEDIAQVLSNLSGGGNNTSSSRNNRNNSRANNRNNRNNSNNKSGDSDNGSPASVVAAFDSGIRITHDENTNSLVIIATPDQIQYVKQVIERLDIRRKQVFVEAVVLELASDETFDFGMGAHLGMPNDDGSLSIFSSQLNGSSFGLSADLLSGMAMGVFGEPVSVNVSDGLGGTSSLSVPAFGIALNALQSNSSVNILSTPNILTLDNEEAAIIVGRNIPFPVSTGRDNNNNPIVSYQREDVAITLKVTPQINESNYVTLTVFQEVQEVEEDSQGLDVSTAGFITSKRSADTTVLVKDNQTVVIGGLIGTTDTSVATKVPLLGDIPIIGKMFRGKRTSSRKSNMLIFLTPHVIDDESDLEEVYRVKVAQRQEFIRRFYGKSRDQQEKELTKLLQYSMNHIDKPSVYRGNQRSETNWEVIGAQAPVAQPIDAAEVTDDTPETSTEDVDNTEVSDPRMDASTETEDATPETEANTDEVDSNTEESE